MGKNIQADEIVHANLLMTDDMYPTPSGAKVVESFGHRKVLDIDENGMLLDGTSVAEGYHMTLEMSGQELCSWLVDYGRPFWLWDDDLNRFKLTSLKTSETNDA